MPESIGHRSRAPDFRKWMSSYPPQIIKRSWMDVAWWKAKKHQNHLEHSELTSKCESWYSDIFRNRCSGTGKDQTSLTFWKFYPISAHRVQTKEGLSEVIISCNLPSMAGVTTMAHALASWTVLEKAYEKVNRYGYVTMYLCKNVSSCVWIGTLVLWHTQSSSTGTSGPA